MKPPLNFNVVIWAMAAAGAERVLAQLANAWPSRGDRVTILTLGYEDSSFYRLEPTVVVRPLCVAGESRNFFEAVRQNVRALCVLKSVIRASRSNVISFIDRTDSVCCSPHMVSAFHRPKIALVAGR
jgi:hypothetical protein